MSIAHGQVTFVKMFYVNSEDVKENEEMLNQWLKEHEKVYEIVNINLSSCYYRDLQTKTTILILYKKRISNNRD